MKQLTVTIPDEFYNSFVEFFKHVPEVKIDESQEEYNRSIEKMVIDRVKNAKPEDYISWEESKKRLNAKWNK
ncbi:hypothetical protein FNW52_02740 [Flavobacterium sp. ZT3R18]|uniref:hypothetical protein n=1 Tax=Flavobacterium sp. ZT3R18 TaxID=2594429 RepID=UPI00117993F6|nr:hypothetical protein [Flavobacterium sp. ZT3R18]TRX37833.1 hypothetical protein FNW52_02740 [Flavobacterium sp. ZT3R18]